MSKAINIDIRQSGHRRQAKPVVAEDVELAVCQLAEATNREQSPLLRLPPELRHEILLDVLFGAGKWTTIDDGPIALPPILQACRCLRAEAAWLFFNNMVFLHWPKSIDDDEHGDDPLDDDPTGLILLERSHKELNRHILYLSDDRPTPISAADAILHFHDEALDVPSGSIWMSAVTNGRHVWINSKREIRERNSLLPSVQELGNRAATMDGKIEIFKG